jgi:SAM-dependent methyltransferase
MSPIYGPFLDLLPRSARILDAGCGSGRDALAFSQRGFEVEAFDASEGCVREARKLTGLPVRQLFFDEMDYVEEFDGIWACASLLHVHRQYLGLALDRFWTALREKRIAYMSFKEGASDGMSGSRWFTNFTESGFQGWVDTLQGWTLLKTWITSDQRPERVGERWINGLIRKTV